MLASPSPFISLSLSFVFFSHSGLEVYSFNLLCLNITHNEGLFCTMHLVGTGDTRVSELYPHPQGSPLFSGEQVLHKQP